MRDERRSVCVGCGQPCHRNAQRCKRCNSVAARGNQNAKGRKGGYHKKGPSWTYNLTSEQVKAVSSIRHHHNGGREKTTSDGWKIYVQPTTLPARYLELRHYMTSGAIARWVIERDGRVSATNDLGFKRTLVPV